MSSDPWDPECAAASLLTHFLGGHATCVDPGGGPAQLHDLDIHLADERIIAVEVTRHNQPEHLAAAAEVRKLNWRFPGLHHDWVVDTIASIRVKSLHSEISGLLRDLEYRGVTTLLLRSEMFDDRRSNRTTIDENRELMDRTGALKTGRQLFNLGVRLVYQLGEANAQEAKVIIGESSRAGSAGPSSVLAAAEQHAGLTDNVTKLAAASDRDERHLFVWAERSRFEVVGAFDFTRVFGPDGLPNSAPALHACIDAVWVATATEPAQVWRYSTKSGWEDLGVYSTSGPCKTSCDEHDG
jgi:hypothetical protein